MTDTPIDFFLPQQTAVKGGKGSGNWGHGGLAGVHGGSSPKRGQPLTPEAFENLDTSLLKIMSEPNNMAGRAHKIQELVDEFILRHTTMGEDVSKRPEVMKFLKRVKDADYEHGFISRSPSDTSPDTMTDNSPDELNITPAIEQAMYDAGKNGCFFHNHPPNEDGKTMNPLSDGDMIAHTMQEFAGKIVALSRKPFGGYYLSVFQPSQAMLDVFSNNPAFAVYQGLMAMGAESQMVTHMIFSSVMPFMQYDADDPLYQQVNQAVDRVYKLSFAFKMKDSTYYEIPLGNSL